MRKRACKIVATMGPASDAPDQLGRLIDTGVDVVRVNFSHGEREEQAERVRRVRAVGEGRQRHVPSLADLQGPKIRVGAMSGGGRDLRFGEDYWVVAAADSDDDAVIPMPHPEIIQALQPGDALKFDDGRLLATVTALDGDRPRLRIDAPGRLTDRKGVNIPGRALPIPALTEKDRADLVAALDADADYIALSFVQRPQDVIEAKQLIEGRARVVAKIEKPAALEHIDAIVAESDAIMVARGDLGVELPMEQVPIAQRRIINAARRAGKPVIVATHMLQSMIEEASPTRAEATDIATAVYQGADAVMLSAETAVGRHPLTAVAVMDRVVRAIEADIAGDSDGARAPTPAPPAFDDVYAFSHAVADLAAAAPCEAVAAFTESGATGFAIAWARPPCPILVVSPSAASARAVALAWGAEPVVMREVRDFEDLLSLADQAARDAGAQSGGRVILAAGLPIGVAGGTNLIHVFEAGDAHAVR